VSEREREREREFVNNFTLRARRRICVASAACGERRGGVRMGVG
jgi:hypothetical protein